ncbi:hypothetical protein [Streptomyces fildesensis]|uniref:hypothetical protein n=1 Tax=Streptomyces fildesensis TaxID=375757 RepID=UPI0018DF611B
MPAIGKRILKPGTAAALTLVMVLLPGTARADRGDPPPPEGGSNGQDLWAHAGGVSYDESKNGSGDTTGPVTPVTAWTPPPCWYSPRWTPAQFKTYVEAIWNAESTGPEWDATQRDRYEKGNPYTNFNLDKAGKGAWWTSYVPTGGAGVPGALDCNEPYFWVDQGDAPPPTIKNAITTEILAQLAYARIRVPDTDISLSPQTKQTVNLATWAWLDKAVFKPVSVTATADVLGISATTTATPVSLHLDPGTKDADSYPASGNCLINKDGSVGTPYSEGQRGDPPCGLKYLRASTGGTFPLKATITWQIEWVGTGHPQPTRLSDGTFGRTTDVTVQEIQAIVR